MANEATLIYQFNIPLGFTCADANAITKGTPLVLSDPFTVAAANAGLSGSAVIGFAAQDKIADSGITKIPTHRDGIFKVTASGSVTVGDPLVNFGNFFSTAAVNAESVVGRALETATNGETFLMELKPTTMQLA